MATVGEFSDLGNASAHFREMGDSVPTCSKVYRALLFNPEVPVLDLFHGSPVFKSTATLCKNINFKWPHWSIYF